MRFAGHEGRKTECGKEGVWECNDQSGAVADPPGSVRTAGSCGCQSHIDSAFDQLSEPRPTTLPLFPSDGALEWRSRTAALFAGLFMGAIPSFIFISNGKMHDVRILDHLVPEPGAFYVMDRGYVDFERLGRLDDAGSFFVTQNSKVTSSLSCF
jgi:hypothetical protein